MILNTLRPIQNHLQFADDTFKPIFLNENIIISIEVSLKFVPKGPINNIPALVQIMAWRRQGDKPLSEPIMVWLPTHICLTRTQCVNGLVTNICQGIYNYHVHQCQSVWYQGISTDLLFNDLKWQCAILAHSQNPKQPVTLADTCF